MNIPQSLINITLPMKTLQWFNEMKAAALSIGKIE